jgi:hypothetical protein
LQPLNIDIVKSTATSPNSQLNSAWAGRVRLKALAIRVPPLDAQDCTLNVRIR